MNIESLLIHGGVDGDKTTGAVSVPIYQTSTYKQSGLGENKGYEYSRTGNPTREALEKLIAELEEGKNGLAFASGMAAITAVLTLFKSGDKIIISDNVYGGTYRVLDKVFKNFDLNYELIDTSDLEKVESSITKEVKAIYIESPTNPLMDITDIKKISEIAKKNNLLTIVDNTFMTPYLQKPIELGADIVLHSATKYLGGHSDLVAGLVVVNDEKLAERLYFIQNSTGGVLGPFDSWLLIRGIKTLSVRMDRHLENAAYIAQFLNESPFVEKVYYPGLESHKGHEIQKKQARGYGAIISFVLKKDIDIKKFFKNLKLITFGESLGGVESLMCHPATMTHAAIPYEIRQKVGIVDNLARLSVGIENKEDLVKDLKKSMELSK
ncbi:MULTISPECIES: bifunctional cystathionine gamma-lyase/homocysteine desulfhydrase [Clostridium]|uniref:Cystathione gamma-synthase n=3 Tax=Clostridium TaxID=1485 RepID=D8GLD7_CLOLD|nr:MULTISPECIES: bifunctional cystathionine gamma-lyase/homocysteine desulfhydrase [Clostridium]ADK15496.1 cystathione gamma-synthase [Clostridium ljungdahlii DSM 13528]AGY74727.1 bifunctional cystathionine gamma-lyase/homocysteine desulfhydrase [Clostridium autoethanogenum DSM 10061]ALU34906.1 Cys/Met metabolism pyridoxal-phosphate-dependent protein [Clostridium autoethanogenum DSM 10061]OAA85504.1 Cystathionine beta-lyase [Clostridium ljungdahlii DSM 13528]OVY51704.1 Cystathionine beta-lyase